MHPSHRSGRSALRGSTLGIIVTMLALLLAPSMAMAVENQTPIGHHDSASGEVNGLDCFASGWAVDPDDLNARLEVRVSVDGNVVATVVADRFRADLLELGISDGFSGWEVNLHGLLTQDVEHSILAEARDAQTLEWHALGSTPKSLTCGNATPVGFHDGNEGTVPTYECIAYGWAVDRDDLTARLEVRILVDGTEVVAGVADLLREDLIVSGDSPDGLAGFLFDLRDLVKPLVTHTVVAQARDNETGEWFDLNSTPRELRCADAPGSSPFAGVWTAVDGDGSNETLTVSGGPTSVQVTYQDDFATVCANAGAPTTQFRAQGTGRLLSGELLEVVLEEGRCGALVIPIDAPSYFEYLAETDQLFSDGVRTWSRRTGP
jgi:hypothetical protein